MKIVYVVDVHENYAAVAKAVNVAGAPDLLIVGGDITTAGTVEEAALAVEGWRPLATRLLAVAGNMDSPAIDVRLAALGVALDGRGVVIGDVGFFGVSAGPKSPLHTPYEITEEQIAERIEAGFAEVKNYRVKIFCPHAPPKDTACDRIHSGLHVGSTAVRAFVEREQPDLVLCGHIHESRGEDIICRTRVVNPGPVTAGHYAVVEIGETLTVKLV
ncbi:MAG: metallophosphoesterase family protein [Verrucomicrobiia bacterium]